MRAVGVRVECGPAILPEQVEPPLLHLDGGWKEQSGKMYKRIMIMNNIYVKICMICGGTNSPLLHVIMVIH